MSFQAKVATGARAYSPDGKRDWGKVPAAIAEYEVSVLNELGDKYVIDQPRWTNGNRWSVEKKYVSVIEEDESEEIPETGFEIIDAVVRVREGGAERTIRLVPDAG